MPSSVKSTPRRSPGHYQRKALDISNELQLKRDEQTAARYQEMVSKRTKKIGDAMAMAQGIELNRLRDEQRAYFHSMHLAYRSRGALQKGINISRSTSLFSSPLESHSQDPAGADSSRTTSTRSHLSATLSLAMRNYVQKQQKTAAHEEQRQQQLHVFPVESKASVNHLYEVKARPLGRVYG